MLLSTNLAQGTTIDDSTKQKVLADTSAAPQGLSGQKDIIPLVLSIKWDLTNLANSYISVYLFQIFKIDNLSLEVVNQTATLTEELQFSGVIDGKISLTVDLENKKITVTGSLTLVGDSPWQKTITIASW